VKRVDSKDLLTEDELQQLQSPTDNTNTQRDISSPKQQVYYFGFDLRASPQEDAAQYVPFLDYLARTTGYQFKLHFTPKNSTTADELGQNKTQFAAMGAGSFLNADIHYGARALVRGVNKLGKAEYRSFFVVRPNSPIKSITDIRGHSLAFGGKDSTQGHIIPRIVLKNNGVKLEDLSKYTYTGSHQNCAEAVVSGKFEVCSMQDQLAQKLAAQGQLRIIHKSAYYPSSGIVANRFVDNDVVEKVRQALLDFEPTGKDSEEMYHWDRTEMPHGFTTAKNTDYDYLRRGTIELGLISESLARGN
jgi:phosphonate transport system substrate-binding protein